MHAVADRIRASLKPALLFIDGAEVEPLSGRTLPVVNPATGETLCEAAAADERDVDRAVRAARRAFEDGPWPRMSAAERGRLLWKVGDLVARDAEALAILESLQNGKTVTEAMRGDLPPSWDIFHYYAGWATKLHGETIPVEGPFLNYTLREPVGVCGQIVPWNYPLLMAAWKLAPALACGNTVVLKPSELTPLTALRLAALCREAGVPPGVVNVVPGLGDPAGKALALHQDVDKLAFTGSTRTARELLRYSAASNLKRLSLELGGKSPNVIFSDADLAEALPAAFWGIFANKGEVCSAGSRLLVERSRYDEVVERLATMAAAMRVGDPLDANTQMGAQTGRAQLEKILGYIARGRDQGATLVAGGERIGERGNFVQPTVFRDVRPEMAIAQDEIFGPVLACIPFSSDDEAVRICNGTTYGLCAAVWTRDVGRAHALARRIRAGTVWVNLYNGFDSASPFGGVRQSGWGREMGPHALELYTEVKSVWVKLDG
ncbi:MAG: aldehyde dehydrogenase family protein [Myxococcota bacterium]